MLLEKLLWIVILTFLPGLELRLSIPVGILDSRFELPYGLAFQGFGLDPFLVFITAVLANILLGPLILWGLHHVLSFFLRFPLIKKFYNSRVQSVQKRIHPKVEQYGSIALALFIAVPLPGSGSWTGALAAFLLGMSQKKFFLVNALGVFLAGILVTAITLGALSFF